MTNTKIKEALKCCMAPYTNNMCHECPYHNIPRCTDVILPDVLDLIIRQEKEISRLKKELREWQFDDAFEEDSIPPLACQVDD